VTDFNVPEELPRQIGFDLRSDARQAVQIIHPQSYRLPVIMLQLARKPPAHTDITEIIDHMAKNIPLNASVEWQRG
jgi:hypothetical protein